MMYYNDANRQIGTREFVVSETWGLRCSARCYIITHLRAADCCSSIPSLDEKDIRSSDSYASTRHRNRSRSGPQFVCRKTRDAVASTRIVHRVWSGGVLADHKSIRHARPFGPKVGRCCNLSGRTEKGERSFSQEDCEDEPSRNCRVF